MFVEDNPVLFVEDNLMLSVVGVDRLEEHCKEVDHQDTEPVDIVVE
jgi:hypothetical protein